MKIIKHILWVLFGVLVLLIIEYFIFTGGQVCDCVKKDRLQALSLRSDNVRIYSLLEVVSTRARQSDRKRSRSRFVDRILFLRTVGYIAYYFANGNGFAELSVL